MTLTNQGNADTNQSEYLIFNQNTNQSEYLIFNQNTNQSEYLIFITVPQIEQVPKVKSNRGRRLFQSQRNYSLQITTNNYHYDT